MELRLQKFLAMAGVASRRKSEELIAGGQVSVNGQVITLLGAKVSPSKDIVTINGKKVEIVQQKQYIMLHKPEGVVTTVTDPFGRPTVMDFIPGDVRLYPVGRLDADTSGLLLLTNDGDWAQKLMHPKNETQKVYTAIVNGVPSGESLRKFRKGIIIDGKKTAPALIKQEEILPIKGTKNQTTRLRITIHEGRNRQVRKMCEAIGHKIVSLKRIEVGTLKLGTLQKGKWRNLSSKEVRNI